MKATGRLVDLRAALAVAAAVPNNRNTIPILGNVRLCLNAPGEIEITTTDLNHEFKAVIPAEVGEGASLTVPCGFLHDAARAVSGDDFAIDLDMMSARFTAGKARFDLPVLPVSDFPDMTPHGEWATATLLSKDLARILSHVLPFIRVGENSVMSSVSLQVVGGRLRAFATDKARLAYAEAPADLQGEIAGAISEKTANLMLKVLEGPVRAELAFTDSLCRLTCGNATLTSSIIGGPMLNYERAIPASFEQSVTINRGALKDALKRTSIVGDDKAPFVRLTLSSGSLALAARASTAFGEASDTIDADYKGETVTIGFLSRHLIDAVAASSSRVIEMRFSDPRKAVRFVDPTDAETMLITMPIAVGIPERIAA
jgi:DNA polymerase-3 subunit beta